MYLVGLVTCAALISTLVYFSNDQTLNQDKFSPNLFSVDFDEALGRENPYMDVYYKKLIKALQEPDNRFFLYIKPHSPGKLLNLCRDMYTCNKPTPDSLLPNRIPRIFHQIWVGKKPFPEAYKKWQKSWQSVPGWSYKLWTDEDVDKLDFSNKELYYREKNMGARSDILRLEILYQFGGVYIDTDFELLQPDFFTLLNSSYDFYCGLSPLDYETLVIANSLIASIPHHPVIEACILNIACRSEPQKNSRAIVNNGPGLLTKMVLLHAHKKYRDIILPPTFFYPLGIEQMQKEPYANMPDTEEKLQKIKQDLLRPESLAIHWWEGSWKLPTSWEQTTPAAV